MSPDIGSTRPLIDKLGVKPGSRVAVLGIDAPWFMSLLGQRTSDIAKGKPRSKCDLVFIGVNHIGDLELLRQAKKWIEPNGAVWMVRPKGGRSEIRDTDLIAAGLAAGLVDNKIASFSETHGAMRFVFRLKDRP
jgi:hypothetical protein